MPLLSSKCEEEYKKKKLARLISAGLNISTKERIRICPHCQHIGFVAKRRLNTAYADDASNWTVGCRECFQDAVDHFNELWETYYS